MNVAIEIPDDIGRVLAAQAGGVSRAVLEAVAIEAYRSGAITPAQVRQMLWLHSRWETESFLRRAEAYHDYTMDDLERDIAAIRDASRQWLPKPNKPVDIPSALRVKSDVQGGVSEHKGTSVRIEHANSRSPGAGLPEGSCRAPGTDPDLTESAENV